MRSIIARFGLIAVLCLGEASNGSPQLRVPTSDDRLSRGTLHVEVFSCFGDPNRESDIQLSVDKQVIAKLARNGEFKNLPYGRYVLNAWDAGGGFTTREVTVNAKDIWVRLGLSFPTGDRIGPPGDLSVSGEILPAPKTKRWWVRVEGMFLHASQEAPLDHSGRFAIGGLEMGIYLVQVYQGSELRHVETIKIDPNHMVTQLSISIPLAAEKVGPLIRQ